MAGLPILSWIVFTPLSGALLLYIMPVFSERADLRGSRSRIFSLLISLLVLGMTGLLLYRFNPQESGIQFAEHTPWVSAFGISYSLGVDGISLFLVALTTFLMPLVVLASETVRKHVRAYLACLLVLESAMLGTFLALDLFLFYVFWELVLAPMYFIIGIWGGKRRIYATLKFVLFTVTGSVLMLVAIMYLAWSFYLQHGVLTFMLDELLTGTSLSLRGEYWLFAMFALAFAIKIPLFPLHTWLPDAHVEAPTGGSVILAGVLLKMGLYGFIRFAYPLFPRAAEIFGPFILGLAVIGIIYGALVAWAQTDIKKLVAYSSVSHLGFCVLGFAAFSVVSLSGAVFQMLSHGIATGALFLSVGVLYQRRHTREISEFGGLASQMPLFAFLFMIFVLTSLALPLTSGFTGEFMILAGSFKTCPWYTAAAVAGVVLGAVYMLTLYLRTMYGELDESKNAALADLTRIELWTLAPLALMALYMGLFPGAVVSRIEPTAGVYVEFVNNRRETLKRIEAAAQAQETAEARGVVAASGEGEP